MEREGQICSRACFFGNWHSHKLIHQWFLKISFRVGFQGLQSKFATLKFEVKLLAHTKIWAAGSISSGLGPLESSFRTLCLKRNYPASTVMALRRVKVSWTFS